LSLNCCSYQEDWVIQALLIIHCPSIVRNGWFYSNFNHFYILENVFFCPLINPVNLVFSTTKISFNPPKLVSLICQTLALNHNIAISDIGQFLSKP
jgi:hypothetical protein